MKTTRKAILVNLGIIAGLAFQFYQGVSLTIIGLTGLSLLLLANIALFVTARRKPPVR
jgi:hypothetical protein